MMENHSYDNFLGMLGAGPASHRAATASRSARTGCPTATNPYPNGRLQRAFRMPTTCQLPGTPSQEWAASPQRSTTTGATTASSAPDHPSARDRRPGGDGLLDRRGPPFTYALATTFPIGDRWFCSCLAQTDPNRRFLIAAPRGDDRRHRQADPRRRTPTLRLPRRQRNDLRPPERRRDQLDRLLDELPDRRDDGALPDHRRRLRETNAKPIAQFFTDAEAGTLPQFSLLDPDYGTQSQENPQNIVVGEASWPRWSTPWHLARCGARRS